MARGGQVFRYWCLHAICTTDVGITKMICPDQNMNAINYSNSQKFEIELKRYKIFKISFT